MMGLYPPLEETGDKNRLQHIAELRFRLKKERNYRALLYKKYRRGANVVDGLYTAFSVASLGLAASCVGLLATIIAEPVAVGIQAEVIVCGLRGDGGKILGRKLQAKARKHDQIRVLAESKLNTIADTISSALTDDKISDEEFRLFMSELGPVRNRVCPRSKKGRCFSI